MSFLFILLISLTQGFTEFLPISSQSHVILVSKLGNYSQISLMEINIILHFGSLFAIIIYNLKSSFSLILSSKNFFRPDLNPYTHLLHNLIISFLPIVFISYLFLKFFPNYFAESLTVIGITSIIFAIILYLVDKNCLRINTLDKLTKKGAFLVGIFQSFAIIPGASRAGTVITALRLFGYNRRECVFFSNLLSIPTIIGAIFFLISKNFLDNFNVEFNLDIFLLFILSFFFSIIFIHFLVSWVRKSSLTIFVIYRIIFGFGVIIYSWKNGVLF